MTRGKGGGELNEKQQSGTLAGHHPRKAAQDLGGPAPFPGAAAVFR